MLYNPKKENNDNVSDTFSYDKMSKKWNIVEQKNPVLLFGIVFVEIERIKHVDKLFQSTSCSITSWAMFSFKEYLNLILFCEDGGGIYQ